jgi:hypothetical protein
MYKFVETLPTINLTDNFLILEDAKNTFQEDWFSFCDYFIEKELKYNVFYSKFQAIRNYKSGTKDFLDFPKALKNLFGFEKGLNILNFKYIDGKYSVILTTNYESIIKQLIEDFSEYKILSFTVKSVLVRFFIFQRYKKRLLFPITTKVLAKIRYDFNLVYRDTIFEEMCNVITNSNDKKYHNMEIKSLILIISSSLWNNFSDIDNEDINKFQTYCVKNKKNIASYERKISVLNKLRLHLINKGIYIDTPSTFTNSIRTNIQSTIYDMKDTPFEWLNITESHKLFPIKLDANLYLKRLHTDGVSIATRKKHMVALNHMFRYVLNEQKNSEFFDENSINLMFNSSNENSLFKYLKNLVLTEGTLISVLSILSKFFEFCGLMTPFAKRNVPRRVRNRRTITPRNAMPQSMLNELKNILMENPPKSNTIWEPSRANLDWWKFKDVYPVQPIMMLMHLNIPIRGGQLRHLCREKSLVFSENGNLEKFIINTDKNVNRDYLQEIPNVWDELNILKDYLLWNKEYFPYLPKYTYNNEDNTPWDDIEPLFLLPNSLQPITPFHHKVYLVKLLCVYQIKMNELYHSKNINFQTKVAWKKDGTEFFQSIKELNQLNDSYLSHNVKIAYNIHAIRVTGITRYLHSGVNLNVLLMLTGHVDYNMIINVYTKFTKEEKKEILKSAVDKIRFDEPKELVQNIENFIFNEIPSKYNISNPNNVKKAFKENGLFSMDRKASCLNESMDIDLGIDLAAVKHPSSWFPMISGICPGVQCPEGRERKCSLCSYFITGKLFLDGVIHMANMSMASFVRLSKEHEKEKNKSSRYLDTRSSKLEVLVEEIMGWHEIIDKIEKDIKDKNTDNLAARMDNIKSIELKEVPQELAYLESCYNAKLMGVEQDNYGMKLLTIKAIQYAQTMKDENEIMNIVNDKICAVDYLMGHYINAKNNNLLTSFIKKLRNK